MLWSKREDGVVLYSLSGNCHNQWDPSTGYFGCLIESEGATLKAELLTISWAGWCMPLYVGACE